MRRVQALAFEVLDDEPGKLDGARSIGVQGVPRHVERMRGVRSDGAEVGRAQNVEVDERNTLLLSQRHRGVAVPAVHGAVHALSVEVGLPALWGDQYRRRAGGLDLADHVAHELLEL